MYSQFTVIFPHFSTYTANAGVIITLNKLEIKQSRTTAYVRVNVITGNYRELPANVTNLDLCRFPDSLRQVSVLSGF
jgi:hypothetical protein